MRGAAFYQMRLFFPGAGGSGRFFFASSEEGRLKI